MRVAREGFDLDLRYGEERENLLRAALGDTLLEAKSHLPRAVQTGNVYIEYEQRGRPSGIAVTASEWWADEVYQDVWVVQRTDYHRRRVEHARRYGGDLRVGGDNESTAGVLVPVSLLLRPPEPRGA